MAIRGTMPPMRPTLVLAPLLLAPLVLAPLLCGGASFAGEPRDALDAALRACEGRLADAAAALLADDDRTAALALGDAAQSATAASTAIRDVRPAGMARDLRVGLLDARRRIDRAADEVGAASDLDAMLATGRAAASIARARRRLGPIGDVHAVETGRTVLVHEPGDAVRLRVAASPGGDVVVELADDGAGAVAAAPGGGGAVHAFTMGAAAGVGVVRVTSGAATLDVRLVNVGPPGTLDLAPPRDLSFDDDVVDARVAESLAVSATVSGDDLAFTILPPLPDGLALDPQTGGISGEPVSTSPPTVYTVTARNARGSTSADLTIAVDPELPAGVAELLPGFGIAKVTEAAIPVRMALLPDGRMLYAELLSGNVRLVSADGALDPEPLVTVPVVTGGERGLLGICASPDFASSGRVYVTATTAAEAGHAERTRVLRYTVSPPAGPVESVAGPDVIVDDLPSGVTQNAGAVEFGPDGMLWVTVGDTGDPARAQDPASLAGCVLRYAPDGRVPASNPDPSSPVWAIGFRNPFDLTFHGPTGGLFVTENGPTAHDELDFVQAGKNFEWGSEDPESIPGPLRGRRIIDWTPVIVPTGLAFHDGAGFGPEWESVLFLAGYDGADVRTIRLSGPTVSDLDEERPFLRFDETGIDGKPLDVQIASDGSLYVSTFAAIWRVTRTR
ncbi:MAG: hypothetical protein HMLKMBBP_01171 [Planctomycetes bacterium]|nr:hypothetical protein [Planctomycetota bacterium]